MCLLRVDLYLKNEAAVALELFSVSCHTGMGGAWVDGIWRVRILLYKVLAWCYGVSVGGDKYETGQHGH